MEMKIDKIRIKKIPYAVSRKLEINKIVILHAVSGEFGVGNLIVHKRKTNYLYENNNI